MLGIACVGTGYWGKNLVRNFSTIKGARLEYICDLSPGTLEKLRPQYPEVKLESDLSRVLADDRVQAVVIATPAPSHYPLAKQALEAGRHVFVEKPLCLEPAHAAELVQLAEARGLTLMVGHLLLYHPSLRWIKQRLPELGRIYYLYTQRLNLGIVRKDENCWWSLAPHDISVALYLLDQFPESVSAQGACYLRPNIEDVVFANLRFADGTMAQLQVSWLDPHKIRKLTVVGDKKMITFDDMEASEKLKVFDKGAERDYSDPTQRTGYGDHISLRSGDIYLPHVDMAEPLRLECEQFVRSCQTGERAVNDGRNGLEVVQILAAAQRSLKEGGMPIPLQRLT
ncbi:MAG: Gfo/Idh/MocA family protein [Myxococcota bacterium]